MIEATNLLKELADKNSDLGKVASAESRGQNDSFDYNESLAKDPKRDFTNHENRQDKPWYAECSKSSDFDKWSDDLLDKSNDEIEDKENLTSNPKEDMNIHDAKSDAEDMQNDNPGSALYCPKEGNGGSWEGERGNSTWVPDSDYTPQKHNPEGKTWGQLKEEYGIDSIDFKDGEPDFSEVSKGEVALDKQESDRGLVFNESDTKLAEQKGCEPWEVYKWRKEHGYTWHETSDGLHAQKVPNIIHGNVSHVGGHSNNVKLL